MNLNRPISVEALTTWEEEHSLRLPNEYRRFLLEHGNGGNVGPFYGLFPLGELPLELRSLSDSQNLAKEFPLRSEWVWEEEQDSDDLDLKISSTEHGVLPIGDEGCSTYWGLIVNGECLGEVWLFTGEGATPCVPRMGFSAWIKKMRDDTWWWDLLSDWGPEKDIWFRSHAILNTLSRSGSQETYSIGQTSPLCRSCFTRLKRFASARACTLAIADPLAVHIFHPDGNVDTIIERAQN